MFLCYLHKLIHIKCRSTGGVYRDRATPYFLVEARQPSQYTLKHSNKAIKFLYTQSIFNVKQEQVTIFHKGGVGCRAYNRSVTAVKLKVNCGFNFFSMVT